MDVIVQHVLEDLNPDFPRRVRRGDIVVAGRHFGQSSGRAIATKGLQATGIGCVVADTFARTFYRNCFEIGLPLFEADGVSGMVEDGDDIEVDVAEGVLRNHTNGREIHGAKPPELLLEMLRAGGLIKLVAERPELMGESPR
jgi:3-isopropylmalate/(R)-2-methylmalate dehydratase small subunit